jgi:hypothetical protein
MRRVSLVLSVTLALFACAMFVGSVLSRAQNNHKPDYANLVPGSNSNQTWPDTWNGKSNNDAGRLEQAAEESSEEGEDPDMPKGKRGSTDQQTYMRLRDEYISRRRGIEPGRPFDPEARGRAIKQMQVQEAFQAEAAKRLQLSGTSGAFEPNAATAAWIPIGPAPLPNGFANQAVTGRVTAVVVDPTNSSKVYLGTAQGGVWRSLDGGTNWTNIFDNALTMAVGSLALAPSNPTILYVGTGESNRSGDSFFGVGVYRIDNADTSATLVGPINPSFSFSTGGGTATTTAFAGRSVSQIVVHPTQPGTIFVGTSSGIGGSGANSFSNSIPPIALLGVYRSTNADGPIGAITFQKLAVATGGNSLDVPATGNRRITDLVMEPGNPDNLIVGVFGNSAPNDGGIFRSTNAVSGANPSFTHVLQISVDRIQFAINKNFNTGVVKVLAATGETPTTGCSSATQMGVLRQSVDGGATWPSADATATTGGILTDAAGFCGAQCFYNVTVAIDPNNANTIYLGGNVQSTCSGLMQRSSNGVTFVHDASGLHPDSHALYFDPQTSTIFAGNDGGIWKRAANASVGAAWTNLNSAPLNSMQFQSVAVHPLDQFMTIGGTQDNGTEVQLSSTGNWSNAEGGDGGYALIDQSATDNTNVTMYHTFYNRTGSQIGFDRIVNVPNCISLQNSWPTRGDFGLSNQTGSACDGTANLLNNGLNRSDNVLFYAPIALGPGTPNTVYFGTDRLYRSIDRGDNMVVSSQAPITGSPLSTIAISPQDDNYRIVGLQNGQVWATSIGSSSLVDITSGSFPANPNGSPTNRFIGRAWFDPHDKNIVYVALSYFAPAGQGVWKLTNFGAATGATPVAPNWTPAGSGIPSVPINAFVVDPLNSNHLYAGTDIGVYNSTDGGASWNPYGTGLPRSAVFDMAIQSPSRILRVATHGRGLWETSIPAAAGGFTVSGRVADSGNNGVSGVLLTIEKNVQGTISTTTTTTDGTGNYSSADQGCSNGVKVTPSKPGYVFNPLAISFVSSGCLSGGGTANFTTPSNQSNTVQFSTTSQSVNETLDQTTKIDLTVTRSGDTSGAATMDYATANGTASDRSDYLGTLGTLRFAANEASKTITVFIVDDRFAEGPETFTVNLSNPVGCVLGSQATFTVTIISNESVDGPNPVKDASFNTDFFVRQHYLDFFNREADPSGLAFWKNEIDSCATQECREIRRINVSAAFFVSIEFQQTGYLVYKANQAAFNTGEFLRLQDFLPDLQEIGRGVVIGQPGADQQLEANKQKFFLDFVQRPTFFAPPFYPTTLTAAQFVDKMNANTIDPRNPGAGSLTPAQRNSLVSQLSPNPASPSLRAQVLRTISENAVFHARQYNKAFVLMQYFGYLRRNPNDPPETNLDYGGYNFWLGKLNQFNGNFVNAEMVKAFIISTEYQARFGP